MEVLFQYRDIGRLTECLYSSIKTDELLTVEISDVEIHAVYEFPDDSFSIPAQDNINLNPQHHMGIRYHSRQ